MQSEQSEIPRQTLVLSLNLWNSGLTIWLWLFRNYLSYLDIGFWKWTKNKLPIYHTKLPHHAGYAISFCLWKKIHTRCIHNLIRTFFHVLPFAVWNSFVFKDGSREVAGNVTLVCIQSIGFLDFLIVYAYLKTRKTGCAIFFKRVTRQVRTLSFSSSSSFAASFVYSLCSSSTSLPLLVSQALALTNITLEVRKFCIESA